MSLFQRAILVAAVASFAAGCNDKVDQCNKLIGAVNDATAALDKVKPAASSTAKDMGETAKALDAMKGKIGAVQLKDEKLKGLQTDYANVVGKAAGAVKSMEGAMEKQDKAAAEAAAKEFKAADKDEDGVRDGITKYCQGS